MDQSLITLILTALLLLGQFFGISFGTQNDKTVDDLRDAYTQYQSSATSASFDHVIGAGSEWESPYYVIDSGEDGPTVMILGALVGDQPAAFEAGERLKEDLTPTKGRVLLFPGLQRFSITRGAPFTAADETAEDAAALDHATEDHPTDPWEMIERDLWKLIEAYNPDWIIQWEDVRPTSAGQWVRYHDQRPNTRWAAISTAETLNQSEDDEDQPFSIEVIQKEQGLAFKAAEKDIDSVVIATDQRNGVLSRVDALMTGTKHLLLYFGMM